jgi:hypothetical protein
VRSVVTLLFAALLALVGVGSGVSGAAPYPPASVVCSISPDPVAPNATVTITCTGFKPGTTVTVSVVRNGVVTTSAAVVPANGTVTVTEKAGPKNGASTFQVSGVDSNGDPASRQVTTHVKSNNGNGNGHATGTTANASSCTGSGSLSSSTASVGQVVTLAGGGFAPNTPVMLTDSAGNDLGSATSNAAGKISAPVAEMTPGDYTVYATGKGGGTCAGRQRTLVAGLTVTRALGSGLPFTGVDGLWLLLLVAVVLVAGGSGVVALERRRRLVRAQH